MARKRSRKNKRSKPEPDFHGLIPVMSASDTVEAKRLTDQATNEAMEADRTQATQPIPALISHIHDVYARNKRHREDSNIDQDMIESMRQVDNKYSPEKAQALTDQGGSMIYMGLTGVKKRGALAWLNDVLVTDSKRPWSLAPTAIPDIPPEVEAGIASRIMEEVAPVIGALAEEGSRLEEEHFDEIEQTAANMRQEIDKIIKEEAEDRALRMETLIRDQMQEGGWEKAFTDFLDDVVALKCGCIKGPILRKVKTFEYETNNLGKLKTKIVDDVRYVYERVDPFKIFPSEGTETPQDGDFIEVIELTRKALADMKAVDGWNERAIDLILERYGMQGYRMSNIEVEDELDDLRNQDDDANRNTNILEGMDYWGSVQGKMLIDIELYTDLDGKAIQPLDEYEINATVVADRLVHVVLNPDPLDRRPYHHTGWYNISGSFWYRGLPELMTDLQNVCNASMRAMVNNMGIASGPQVVLNDVNRLANGETITNMHPWKIWQFQNKLASGNKPIDFFHPASNASELMAIYQQFAKLADDYTGVPAFVLGNDRVAGAGRTASGLSILMNSAARGLKRVIAGIDRDVLKPVIKRQYEQNMMFSDDDSIKGDVEIRANGILSMIIKEQMSQQRMSFLQMANNPTDLGIIDEEHRANVYREAAVALEMEPGEVVPSKEDMRRKIAEAEQQLAEQQQMQMALAQQQVAAQGGQGAPQQEVAA